MGLRQAFARWRAQTAGASSPRGDRHGARTSGADSAARPSEPAMRVLGPGLPPAGRDAPRHAPSGTAPNSRPPLSPERSAEQELVRAAWDAVADRPDELMRQFYAELFLALGDEALQMFPAGMERQRGEFARVLVQWVSVDDPEALSGHLDQLGADHRKFGTEPRHYETVGQALVTAWSRLAGERWHADMEHALIGSYTRLAARMIEGAQRREHEPPFWGATVVGHHRLLPDFAVVTVQPDAPYAFAAGQYLTLELKRLPKQWRSMSVASAPRSNNTLDLWVRSVSDTGVSGALVMHTAAGDRLRLGAPRGASPLGAARTGRVLLCVCSGTGVAPVAAVIESLLAGRDCPEIEIYIGARDATGLFAVDHLGKLVAAAGRQDRVRVHGVVADDPSYPGHRGRVEQVVPRLDDWAGRGVDVLIAGPDPMIAATVRGLADAGVPADRIRFDQYDLPG